jgi:hypothetical protein
MSRIRQLGRIAPHLCDALAPGRHFFAPNHNDGHKDNKKDPCNDANDCRIHGNLLLKVVLKI